MTTKKLSARDILSVELHKILKDDSFYNDKIEGLLRVSRTYLPSGYDGNFSLRTKNRFQNGDKVIEEGSYLIIDPKDRVIADGRLMVFFINGALDVRRCNVGERVWLERPSDKNSFPVILTKEEAYEECVGFVQTIIPIPKF